MAKRRRRYRGADASEITAGFLKDAKRFLDAGNCEEASEALCSARIYDGMRGQLEAIRLNRGVPHYPEIAKTQKLFNASCKIVRR